MVSAIKGYERYYSINIHGEVFSVRNRIILKPVKSKKGYLTVCLQKNGQIIRHTIHRLVAKTFIPNPSNKPQVNHKDGDKENNEVDNLEWVTNTENWDHAIKNGLLKVESKSLNHARSVRVINTETGEIFPNITKAAKSARIIKSTLCYILKQSKSNNTPFRLL